MSAVDIAPAFCHACAPCGRWTSKTATQVIHATIPNPEKEPP
ncbi:hypothetical protein MIZ03_4742 [Rhodoferax lithotrophicus]|uniref:Uncharacterized protein n=1 Tax=Rhodoferax lithotrophicus TaxID=2798804 RepID=A0ABM7MU04_9BURK|nr:hypothetical protein MIZ03_4742 [Rhodoferax sp. MIZ03]